MAYAGVGLAISIKRLDFNIAYACNLACKGCISLSDFDRRGVESVDSIEQQCSAWSKRITPHVITLFGGEPLLHPHIHNVIKIIKQHWPESTLRLITNGYLLKKHDPSKWFDYKPFEMQISMHRRDHQHILKQQIRRILECHKGWKVIKHNKKGHKDLEFVLPGFSIYKSNFGHFVKPYRDNVTPFNSNPETAHSICGAPATPVLYKNKLYKCPPVANILDIIPGYVEYEGLGHNSDLANFIAGIGKPESVCAMCPENISHSVDHYAKENVHVKHID
jgi:hypothetical protein